MSVEKDFNEKYEQIHSGIIGGAFRLADIGPEDILYHYTRIQGFMGILNQQEFWATDYRYLNDEDEFVYVHNILVKVIKEEFGIPCADERNTVFCSKLLELMLGEMLNDYYVVSFSCNSDNLTLWAEFASPGCNIGFKPFSIFERWPLYFGKVIYDEEQQKAVVRNAIRQVLQHFREDVCCGLDDSLSIYLDGMDYNQQAVMAQAAAELVMYYGIAMKSKLFCAEDEYRAVFTSENKAKKYRMRGDMLVPYIEVPVRWGIDGPDLVSVTLAPLSKGNLSHLAVSDFLGNKGCHNVSLKDSELNMRF